MVILNRNKKNSLDSNIQIILLNQHTQNILLIIITQKKFLNNI